MVYQPRVDLRRVSETEVASVTTTGYGSAVEVFNFASEKPTVKSYLMDIEGNQKPDKDVTAEALAEFTGRDVQTRIADAKAALEKQVGERMVIHRQLGGMSR